MYIFYTNECKFCIEYRRKHIDFSIDRANNQLFTPNIKIDIMIM